jgi:hypothetical protein
MTDQDSARIKQLDMAIICLDNADYQGPEGRAQMDKLRKERREIMAKYEEAASLRTMGPLMADLEGLLK